MNDTEVIRKAVELAGWQTTRLGNQSVQVFVPHGEGGEHPLLSIGQLDYQWVLDALAAQLVRQVLAAGFDVHIDIQGSHFEAPGFWLEITDMNLSESRRYERDARDSESLNTMIEL